jgi:hypothetical protein
MSSNSYFLTNNSSIVIRRSFGFLGVNEGWSKEGPLTRLKNGRSVRREGARRTVVVLLFLTNNPSIVIRRSFGFLGVNEGWSKEGPPTRLKNGRSIRREGARRTVVVLLFLTNNPSIVIRRSFGFLGVN